MQPPRTQAAPMARRTLILLLLLNLLCYLDRYILSAVEPQIRKEFFAADDPRAMEKVGWLATAFLLSYMVTSPIFGWLSDRLSRWWIIAFGVAVWSLASAGSGFAATYLILFATRIFVGIGEAAYGPASPTILSDIYPIERRGLILAWFFAAIPVGSAIGYMFGGMVGGSLGWRWAFYLVGPPGLILAALCLFMRDPRPAKKTNERHATFKDYLGLFRIPSYTINVLAQTAMTFAIGGLSFWAPTYINQFRGQPDMSAVAFKFGLITAIAGLGATLVGGWLGDFFARKYPGAYFYVSAGGMLIAFPCTVAMLFLPFPYAWIAIFCAVFFLFFNIGPANTAIANVTAPGVRSTAFAVNIFVIHALGDSISPPLIGWIADRWNMNYGFFLVSLMMLAAGLLWLAGAKFLQRDVEKISRLTTPG